MHDTSVRDDSSFPPQEDAPPTDQGPGTGEAAASRILDRVAELTGPRASLATAFAATTLRRVAAATLERADHDVAAAWLVDAFRWMDETTGGDPDVRLWNPSDGIDGRGAGGTVVEVVGVDRPFLLSTVTRTIEATDAGVVRRLHPIFGTERDEEGQLTVVGPARHADHRETFLHVELDRRLDDHAADVLRDQLVTALRDVRRVTDDHHAMRERVSHAAARLEQHVPPRGGDVPDEVAALLRWLLDDNLVLLGWRAYTLDWDDGPPTMTVDHGSGLGILADETSSRFGEQVAVGDLPEEVRDHVLEAPLLRVTRTRRRATVHRLRPMLDLVFTWHDRQGRPVRLERLLGLFTAAGLGVPAARTPVLRDRLRRVLEAEDTVPGSHEEIMLVGLFQSLPKDELLELDVPSLRRTLVALLDAEEHRRVRAVVRTDPASGTVTVVLAVPRDDYGPAVRQRVTDLLLHQLGGPVDVDVSMGEHAEVVARFTLRTARAAMVDTARLEGDVTAAARPWVDVVRALLVEAHGEAEGTRRWREVAARLPATYRDRVDPDRVVADVARLDHLLATDRTTAAWIAQDASGTVLLLAQDDRPLVLSDVMPVLEAMGLRVHVEHPHVLAGVPTVHLHEFRLEDPEGVVAAAGEAVTETIVEALAGRFEVDSLARLVVTAGVTWRDVAIVRAYRRYRRQVGTSYSAEYANDAVAAHPQAVRAILEVFRLRFDPDVADRDGADHLVMLEAARLAARGACDAIERLDHDRIVRGVLELVDATVRTSAYVRVPGSTRGWTTDAAGRAVPVLAFKFDPSLVPDMPAPAPHREIFVSSPAVEGIHLRSGPIARGGLRFSDRHDDLRTEILGLMKAQVLKNAMIVPTGAKGGYVCKRLPLDRDAAREDARRQYVAFVNALLDVTDDVVGDDVVHPDRVVCHDGDDPYLVVAADRGTATFSDVANDVAVSRGFWLGDAFASGGSAGYDHKALGITARGAWTVVTRHFAELGIDVQTDPITVAGVGDMSGDVFGNGMLLSRSIRLVAAFDHRDVFLDPDPDPARSFDERQRLLALPRSSWQDYDRAILSPGGMVVPRSSKTVTLTAEVRKLLDLDDETVSIHRLLQAVLRVQVDLLWFGGIGTYVKASTERQLDVGDKVNDDIRVDATELRARVVGEGANLAVTPRARVQYARRGGRIDQDAVHNVAGVDISDHEVNLKILLKLAEDDGRLDRDARDAILVEVTDDVVTHVLQDVDRQASQLSRLAASSPQRLDDLRALVDELEARGVVHRELDVLPSHDEFEDRAQVGAGLTRPELATLMAGAKRVVAETVRASDLPDDPVVAHAVATYFPPRLMDAFGDLVPRHRLHRALVATIVANDLVDRLGPVWPFRLADETGRDLDRVLAATLAAWHVLEAGRWWDELSRAEQVLASERTHPLATTLAGVVMSLTRRLLDDDDLDHVDRLVARDRPHAQALLAALPRIGPPARTTRLRTTASRLTDDLVDPDLADLLAGARDLALVADVAQTCRALHTTDTEAIADVMLRIAAAVGLDRLMALVDRAPVASGWERRERKGLMADVQRLHASALVAGVTRGGGLATAVAAVTEGDPHRLARIRGLLGEVETMPHPPISAVSVVVRAYTDLLGPRH